MYVNADLYLVAFNFKVTMVVSTMHKIKANDKVPHKIYEVAYKPNFLDTIIPLELEGRKLEFLMKLNEVLVGVCDGALNSTKVLKELKEFDVIIYDSISPCGALVGELLSIPTIEIITNAPNTPFGFSHMIPVPVSYVPQTLAGLTDKMSFMERVMNLIVYLGGQVFMNVVNGRGMDALKAKYNIKPERSFQETRGNAEMVIITADFALEYPQPLLPGMKKSRKRLLFIVLDTIVISILSFVSRCSHFEMYYPAIIRFGRGKVLIETLTGTPVASRKLST